MEQIISAFLKSITSGNFKYLLIVVIFYTAWNWNSRNRFERIFLTRNTAILYKILIELLVFLVILFTTLLPTLEIESLLNPSGFSWDRIALLGYILTIILSTLYAVNFKEIRENSIMKNKITAFFLITLALVSSWFVFLNLVQLVLASIGKSLGSEFNETRQVLVSAIQNQDFTSLLISLLIFAAFFYFPIKFTLEATLQEFTRQLKIKKTQKVIVVLKNGKKVQNCFMNNNHPGRYLHLANKSRGFTQHIAINKEEIEYILITDDSHRIDSDISIT